MTAAPRLPNAYRGYRFPGEVIAHAVWLYLRFPLSFRDVEELLAERCIRVSYEKVRCWVAKFGPQFTAQLRKQEARPGRVWHLDEMAVRIGGRQHWLWRAVDEHGATLDVLLQEQRDTDAAERFFQVLLGHARAVPDRINTDKLGSYAAAIHRLPELVGVDHQQVRSAQRCNNRVEQAHQPTRVRERRMGRFRCPVSAQRFLTAFTRIWNHFRPRRRSFTAPEYRAALQERFAVWRIAAELRP
jgi:putative transposase